MDDMTVLESLRHMIDVAQPPVQMGAPLPTGFWVAIVDYVNAAPRLLEVFEAAIKQDGFE